MAEDRLPAERDWVARPGTYFLAWGLPTLALIAGIFLPAPLRTPVWVLALVWKGLACLINARRCRRTHCRYTGPFFLALAVLVLLHGTGTLSLGADGWLWLGAVLVVGTAGIWWASERRWGRYRD